ncbi:MAG: reprolysin-like metallopeptidase [Bacteroidota bacterium]
MTIKHLSLLLCLFCAITLSAQVPDMGIREGEPMNKIQVNPEILYSNVSQSRNSIIELPFGQLGYGAFMVEEDQMLSPEFAKARPDIKTYKIQSVKDKSIKGRMLLTPESSWASILTPQGLTSFYPNKGVYFLEEGIHTQEKHSPRCTHFEKEGKTTVWQQKMKAINNASRVTFTNGGTRRIFDLAVVCTGEYYQENGNTDNAVTNSIAATVNALNVIYENELSVRLTLQAPVLFSNPATDPFIPDNMGGDGRTVQASRGVDMNFNLGSYDIGHVFHNHSDGDGWSNGGVAYLGVVCDDGFQSGGPLKAGGWSGAFNNVGNGWVSLAAHEFGHMFNATHTFNGQGESCDDAISSTSAFEIGSGTTIMSYQGICAPAQNIPGEGEANNYFHAHSLSQMVQYLNVFGDCANEVPLNNSAPIVAANPCAGDIVIPRSTPFMLTGSATDAEDDDLTYCWEQYDEDGLGSLTQGFIGTQAGNSSLAPLFRSYPPETTPTRYFPRLSTLKEGANSDPFDVLPRVQRTLNMQLTARDNNSVGGGVASNELSIAVDASGPLTLQNISSVVAGIPFLVDWTLNGTEELCDVADILLSLDGGQTFNIILAEAVDYNSGSFEINLPGSFPNSEEARIMLKCADAECYAFFDITDSDFDISSTCLAGSSIICDSEFETFEQGDPSLNLDLSHIDGRSISSISRVISNSIPTIGPIALIRDTGDCGVEFDYFTNTANITVDKTGNYGFTVDIEATGGNGYFSIFEADSYNEINPCSSFVGSSAVLVGGGISYSTVLNVMLEECKNYLMIFTNNTPQLELPKTTVISNIEGPGNIIEINDSPNPDYDNTFIAVDEDGIIEVVSPVSDFTALSGGMYDIYTVTYKSGGATPPEIVDPSTWVGTALSTVQPTDCLLLSVNKKPIEVDFSCRINSIEAGMQTQCDPLNNFYTQELIITYQDPPLSGNLTVNGTPFPITGSPQTVILVGQIADGMSYDVSASFSDLQSCARFVQDVYTAPENCCPIELDLGEDREVCDIETIILDAGTDGMEYKWFKDGIELMVSESILEVTESGFYLVEVMTETGCAKFDEVNIVINPTPTVELDEDVSVCEGEIYIIQANTNAPNLIWAKDNVELIGQSDPSLLVTEGGMYVLTGSNSFGCVAVDTIMIEYVTRPVVELGEDQQFCAGESYVLDAGMDGTEYTWSRNAIVLANATDPTLEVTESGQYTVIVDKGGGCNTMDTVDIEFLALSEVFAGADINVCEGSEAEILAFVEADSFEWFFNGVLFSDQTDSPTVTEGGEYVLVGRNEIGCESFDTVIVTEVMPPQLDLGEDKVGCIGSAVELTLDSIGTVFWVSGGMLISENATISVTEPGMYIANVIAASNCTGRDTINVTFEPGPSLDLGEDKEFCMGDSEIITATSDGDNITWFLNDVEIAGENTFELMVSEAGEYRAVVIGSSNCEVEDVIMVTVNETPDLVLGDDEMICEGESVTLMTDFGAMTYNWELNGMMVSDEPSVEVSEPGVYTLTVINEFDCSDSDDIEVITNPLPTVDIEESYSICEGESVEIEAISDGVTFNWFVDGVEVAGGPDNTFTVDAESTVRVVASTSAGCTADATTQVNIAPAPVIDLGDDLSLCPSESFVLNAGNHATYMWSTGQETSTINIVSIDPEMATQEAYSVTVTNETGCSAEDEVIVDFFPVIIGEIMASASGVCDGEPVQLTAFGGLNYEWVDPNGTLSEIEGPSALASPTESTTYQVLISDDCPGNTAVVTIDIEVFEAGLDVDAGEDDCAVNGSTLELNASGGVAYEWEENGTIISGADTPNPIVSPTVDTVYFVNITDANGCVFRDSVNVCVLEDPLENFKLVSIITPNGDGDNDELRFEGLEAFPDNTLTIYNRWGYPVFERKRYQAEGELWNGENAGDVLPADTYYYILTFDGNTYKSSITIMR